MVFQLNSLDSPEQGAQLASSLTRRATVVEGLYSGLMASTAAPQQEAKVKVLVEAPAAVEDALAALLLDTQDAVLQVGHPVVPW